MTLYDYECQKCNKVFEESLPMNNSETALCPICGEKAKKVFIKAFKPHVSWSQWSVGIGRNKFD
jgi:putative FmdB family regulatory protein